MKLFVYGTLMRGERNHERLDGCKFLRKAETDADLKLMDNGQFPAVTVGQQSIKGEIYGVPDEMWPMLDGFEGVPTYYERLVMHIGGERVNIYVGAGCLEFGKWKEIPSGNYKDRK